MTASSRSRLAAAAIAVIVLITGVSHGRLLPLGASGGPAAGPSFFVTNEDDTGPGSLRQALVDANARRNGTSPDRILFAIPGGGVHTIAPRSPLPAITESVVIDGYSQEGARPNALGEVLEARATDGELMVAIDGAGAGDADGLVLLAGDSAIRGLAIGGFTGSGIRIEGSGHNRIEGNVLGASPHARTTGGGDDVTPDDAFAEGLKVPSGNGGCGITIVASPGNAVGGLDPAARNVIRGNACAVRILGATATGNAVLGNSVESDADGIVLEDDEAPRASVPATDQGPNRYRSAPSLRAVERILPGASGKEGAPSATSATSTTPATIAQGSLSSVPRTAFRIELFASDAPAAVAGTAPGPLPGAGPARAGRRGERLVASRTVTTSEDGSADLRLEVPILLSGGTELTATATDPEGNTSELSLPLLVPGAVISWKNAVDGNWDNTANWNPAQVPGASDTADISLAGTYTVNVNANATLAGLTLGGASGTQKLSVNAHTLTLNGAGSVGGHGDLEIVASGVVNGSGNITVDGTLDWTFGSMAGTGSTTVNGSLNLSGASQKSVQRTINNSGTATWTGGDIRLFLAGGVFNNSGTFDAQADGSANTLFDAGSFHNTGLFKRTSSATPLPVSVVFDNDGTVDVQTGGLTLTANDGAGNTSGSYDATGAELRFNGTSYDFVAGSSITGSTVVFDGGTVTIAGTYNVSSTEIEGGTVNLNAAASTQTLALASGTLSGSAAFTVSGPTTWSAGTMDGAGSTTCNGGLALDTAGQKGLSRTLNSPGATTWTDGTLRLFLAGGLFNNSGTFDAQADGTGSSIFDAGTFHNTGTFKRTAVANILPVTSVFDNDGTVDSQVGGLSFGGGGGATSNTGSFDATGNLLRFSNGTFNLAASASITGTTVEFTGATVNHTGTYNVTGTTRIAAGAAHLTGTVTNAGSALEITSGTLDFSSGEAIQPTTLTQDGGTLTGSDSVTVSGLTTWSAGTMDGTGSTNCNGGLVLDTAGQKAVSRTLNSPGTATFTDGTLRLFVAGGLFNNSGTFDAQADGTGSSIFDAGTFHNTGTFKRTAVANILPVTSVFDNDGTVDSQVGGLSFGGGGGATSNTGSFDATGNLLRFSNGTFNLAASASITGTTVEFTGATVNHTGAYNVTGTTRIAAGAAHLTGTVTNAGAALEITSGTLDFSSGEAILPTTLTQDGGTLTGSDTVTVSGLTTWSAGTMDGAGSTHCNGGLVLDTGGQKALSRTLNSPGTATFTDGTLRLFVAGGLFNNSGTFDAQADGTGSSIFDAGTFHNTGTFKRTAVANILPVTSVFDNDGTVDSQIGGLSFGGGGGATSNTGSFDATGNLLRFSNGTFNLAASAAITGTTVEFTGATVNHTGTYNVTGTTRIAAGAAHFTGTVTNAGSALEITSGTLDFSSGEAIQPTTLTQDGGTLTGSDTVTVSGLTTWSAGTMDGTGSTHCNGGLVLDTAGQKSLSRTLNSPGAATWTDGVLRLLVAGGVFNNSGTFDAQADGTGSQIFDGGSFHNTGTFKRTAIDNTLLVSSLFTNAGTVRVDTGALNFTAGYTQTAGTTLLSGGDLSATTNSLNIQGGALAGSGTITGDVNVSGTGALSPGTSPGAFGMTGPYTQSGAGSAYTVEIGGTSTSQYDHVDLSGVPGTASLAGGLNVSLVNSFTPANGDSFTIMTYTSHTGSFTPNLPSLPGGLVWNVAYNPTSLVLSVGGAAASADLSIAKTDSPDPVDAGATLTYTLTVTNAGPDTASALTVTDTLPAGLTSVTGSGSGWTCGAPVAGVLTCTRPSLAVATAPVITITGTAPAAGPLSNTASVSSAASDPVPGNNSDTESTAVTPSSQSADLSIVKTDTPDPVDAGSALAYTLTVTNAGPDAATAITVTDTFPAGLTSVTGSGTGWTCPAPAAGVLTCTRASLAVTTAPVITVTGTAPPTGPLSNTASVSSATSDPVPGNNSDTESTTVTPAAESADLSIVKTDSPDPVDAGATLTYTLTVTNAGPDIATALTVGDQLPAGLTNVVGSGSGWTCGAPVSGVLSCTRPSLAVTTAPVITITATAPANGPLSNTAAVASTTPDPNPSNNSDTEGTAVTPAAQSADLSIVKTDTPDPVAAGAALAYTLTVTNAGPDTATAITVTDTFPAGLTSVTGSGTGWTCPAPAAGVLTCTRASLAVTTAPVITVTGTAPPTGPLSNTASVSSATSDPVPGNNSDTESTAVTPSSQSADLSIVKTDTPDPVGAGAALTYLLAVTNNGPNSASSITVTDSLPAGLTNVVGSGNGWTCSAPVSGVLTCTRPNLAIVTAPVITITGTAPAGGPLSNTASVTSATSDPNTANNSDTEGTTVTPAGQGADLAISKGDDPDPVKAGQPITWTLDVTNAGPSVASRVVVTDTLPPGVSQLSVSGTDWSCSKTVTAVLCARVSLAVGPAPPITITAVAPGTAGVMTNQADVSSNTTDPVLGNNFVSEETTVSPVHDIAVLKVKVPNKVKLGGSVSSRTQRIKVQIQNRSPHDETIADEAMLGSLVHVTADSLGACPDLQGTVLTGTPQASLPGTLHPEQKVNLWFEVTFSTECVNDPAKSSGSNPGHEDYQFLVTADHAALDGQADSHAVDDVCPRSVTPPFQLDPYPDGSIKDKGCGKQKGDKTFGDPIKTDVWVSN